MTPGSTGPELTRITINEQFNEKLRCDLGSAILRLTDNAQLAHYLLLLYHLG